MRSKFRLVLLLFTILSFPGLASANGGLGLEKLLWEANQLFLEHKDAEALEKYELLLAANPEQQEALTKASIVCGRIGNRFPDDTHKGLYFQKAYSFASTAWGKDSLEAENNFVMALALSNLSQTASLKERMLHICQTKRYLDKALSADSLHAGAWHLLGRWAYKAANLSFAEKSVIKLISQEAPSEVTNELAIDAISKAIAIDPNNLVYYYDLARVQREANLKSECVNTLQRAIDQKLVTTEDLELSRRCKVLLKEVLRIRT
ncbi:hypothetical protein TH63_07085 [Rufibacter radiotolerans]|uniref:Tetratricopeptide repeat protein n=1 Tax=Rufibacter radiotolerans TaxID=1379910 RepID=A0A0H4W4V0_9BACT|nr:hypothetical protein TH63_07085 [Rufibacter radiotolerans]